MIYAEDATLDEIYKLIKSTYGNCTSVNIVVNCDGLTCNTSARSNISGYSMRTIDGNWIKKGE